MDGSITFRPVGPADQGLLYEIYASTRADELAIVPWSDEQKAAFLRMQFEAQRRDYEANYPDASFQVILRDGVPAGRLYVDHRDDSIHIIDIALLPAHRNAGIGSRLLTELQAEAARAGKPVCIHVERFNPAQRLYRRLGFREIADQGVYWLMEWSPPAAAGG